MSIRMVRRSNSPLLVPHSREKSYFFIIEPGSKLKFAFVTPKIILGLWTARLVTSENSILFSKLCSHH